MRLYKYIDSRFAGASMEKVKNDGGAYIIY